MEGSPGRRQLDDTSQDQGMTTDVGRISVGVAAVKSKTAFSDGHVGLP